jgi:FeS assembly SUF system protein
MTDAKRPNEELEKKIVAVLRTVFDPEIPVNVYDLGLIYGIEIDEDRNVDIRMTLTSPGCPVADALVAEVTKKVRALDDVGMADVELVFEPPWTPELLSDAARLDLNLDFGEAPKKHTGPHMYNIGGMTGPRGK